MPLESSTNKAGKTSICEKKVQTPQKHVDLLHLYML